QAHRRHRALAVPPGAQARRQAARRLAVRLPLPVSQVGQPGAAPRLRPRPAHAGRSAVAAGLRAVHRTLARQAGNPRLSPRAVHGTLITVGMKTGQAVNGLVLSGAPGLVLSGAPVSCYQARKSQLTSAATGIFSALNFISNFKIYLTHTKSLLLAQWITAQGQQRKRLSGRSLSRLPQRRAAP